ncbi:MAG: glycosyltransferase family 4 protein [Saprospiraceae bacterium]
MQDFIGASVKQGASKTIWVFNQFAGHPESGWGERHYYFARYWMAAGYRVVLFSGSYNHMFKLLPETKGRYTHQLVNGIEFCWVKVPHYRPQSILRFWSMLVFAWRVFRIRDKQYGTPDAIIVSSMPIFSILSALLLKRRIPGLRVLFEIRDIWPLSLVYLAELSKYHPAVLFIGWFEKMGYRYADKVVSLLPNARKHIEAVAGKPVSFHYIPNGIEADLLVDEALEAGLVQQIPPDKFIIGYTGTMALANALESFVEAARLLKEQEAVHFVLVGDGYLKAELESKSKDLTNITFVPKIRKNQVQAMLKHFDVCFVGRNDSPLFQHGVSANKYFDYMLAGKPVLDANNYIKDPVELSGCGILVRPESAEAIVQGVMQLYNMQADERERMGRLGYEYVTKHHSIRYLAEVYLGVIEEG